MTLPHILIFGAAALLVGLLTRNRNRLYPMLAISILAVYTLQPALPVRGLDFWLPTATLVLAALSWFVTASPTERSLRGQWPTVGLLAGIVAILASTRYIDLPFLLTAGRPPQVQQVAVALVGAGLLGIIFSRAPKWLLGVWLVLLLVIFLVLKTPALAAMAGSILRGWTQQSRELASAVDVRWLGFSYVAFRIIHTIRDRQSGRLPAVSLGEYVTYVIFFPSLTAGPIDRLERFTQDLRKPLSLTSGDLLRAGERLVVGLFKKFIVADSLALIALNATNAGQVQSAGWMWVLLYAYSFQIFFDFSGYTDVAIGIGLLVGIKLPENFNAPYRKPNLTQFWNNWHMTLTQWFRAYFFNPITRSLRSKKVPIPIIIFVTQIATMMLIGLWHGVTWNFVLWGLWHGLGLFIHNRWSEWTRARAAAWAITKARQVILNVSGALLTFHFVALGWVFFALPTPDVSWKVLLTLFGAGS